MVSFNNALDEARKKISEWTSIPKIQCVTLVRDAKGTISVYLEPITGTTLEESEVLSLQQSLAVSLGIFFQGNVYTEEPNTWTADLFDKVRSLRIADSPIASIPNVTWYRIERGISKKAWIECNGRETAVWPYETTQTAEKKPKVVTFFSYKGGMGRTTSLVSVALELSRRKKNVLMIDTDLEAPGLSTFFFPPTDSELIQKGTVDFLLERGIDSTGSSNMADYILSLTDSNYWNETQGNLYLVPSGRLDRDYLLKLARIDSQELVEGRLKDCFEKLLNACVTELASSGGIDYILLDSRAGFHDMAGIITAQLPHAVVLFGKDSAQSWFGIEEALHTIAESQSDPPFVIMTDSNCGQNGIIEQDEKEHFLLKSYEVFCAQYYSEPQPGLKASDAHNPVYIPYDPILSGDIPLYDSNRYESLLTKLATTPYIELTQRIMQFFDDLPDQEGV